MGWIFLVILLLIVVLLFNFRRRQSQGDFEMAGLNLVAAMVLSIADAILAQFV